MKYEVHRVINLTIEAKSVEEAMEISNEAIYKILDCDCCTRMHQLDDLDADSVSDYDVEVKPSGRSN